MLAAHGSTQNTSNPVPKPRTRSLTPKEVVPEVPKRKPPPKPERIPHAVDEDNAESIMEPAGAEHKSVTNTDFALAEPEGETTINKNAHTTEALISQLTPATPATPPEPLRFEPVIQESAEQNERSSSEEQSSAPHLDELIIPDDLKELSYDVFSKPPDMGSLEPKGTLFSQLCGMNDLGGGGYERQNSISSVKSLQSFAGFTGGLRKWHNLEDLDDLSSEASLGPCSSTWVIEDQSETGMWFSVDFVECDG